MHAHTHTHAHAHTYAHTYTHTHTHTHTHTCAGLGVLAGAQDEDNDEFEIDLNDAEPAFLRGGGSKSGIEMSPIKIVKNPDGTMQRSAMTQVRLGLAGWLAAILL